MARTLCGICSYLIRTLFVYIRDEVRTRCEQGTKEHTALVRSYAFDYPKIGLREKEVSLTQGIREKL